MTKKTYLMPQACRRGQPTIVAAIKETSGPTVGYWMAVWSDLQSLNYTPAKGIGKEYGCSSRTRISPELYKAMVSRS